MTTSLEDLLNNNGPLPKATAEPQAAIEAQPAPPEPEEDTPSQEAVTGDTEPSPSATPPVAAVEDTLDKKISAFQRKAEDETRKRQDYEKRLQDAQKALEEREAYIARENERFQQHLAQQRAQAQQQNEIDLYDPEHLQKYITTVVAQKEANWHQNAVDQRIALSRENMVDRQDRYPDYLELEQSFAQRMAEAEKQGDYSLRERMEADLLPAKFAYDYEKRVKALEEIGPDPVSFRERVIQEYLAQQAQAAPQQPAQPTIQTLANPAPQPPKTLAGVPSAARNVNRQPWKGPTPLEQLLS